MQKSHLEIFHLLLGTTKGLIRKILRVVVPKGLTGPQFGLLMHLHRRGPLTPSELSDTLCVTMGNITGLIQRLKKLGFVERRRSSTDRRILRIALTDSGSRKIRALIPLWEKTILSALKPLTNNDRKLLFEILSKVSKHLGLSLHEKEECNSK